MKALNRKLLRDLRLLWSQALTIALVVASGVGGFLTTLSAVDSLARARDDFYAQGRFADVFAGVRRAPLSLQPALQALPGVADVQLTVERPVRLRLPDRPDPLLGQLIGVDPREPRRLNAVFRRESGGVVEVGSPGPVRSDGAIPAWVSETFAQVHGLQPGDRLQAVINGKQRDLVVRAAALSPEYIFAGLFGMPDPRGFGVFWVAGVELLRQAAPPELRTLRKPVEPRTAAQKAYVEALLAHELAFGIGPAGTGKTYLAVAVGVSLFLAGEVERIVLSRPAVEAGERLGFLPGDMREKIDPYMQPLYDALNDFIPARQVQKLLEEKRIEIAPLAFMRGRTLAHAFVVLDEAQNATTMQMKMFLTRLGEGSRMVITGDRTQVDLPRGIASGLADAERILAGVPGVSFSYFTARDVVRHPLVARIIEAYGRDEGTGG